MNITNINTYANIKITSGFRLEDAASFDSCQGYSLLRNKFIFFPLSRQQNKRL